MEWLKRLLRGFYRQTPTLRKIFKVLVVAALSLCVLFLVAGAVLWRVYEHKLEKEIAHWKAIGGVMDAAEIAPTGDGYAPRLIQAAGLVYKEPPSLPAQVQLPGPMEDYGYGPPEEYFSDPNVRESAKGRRAFQDFEYWEGFQLSRTAMPGGAGLHGSRWLKAWVPYLRKDLEENVLAMDLVRKGALEAAGCFDVDWQGALPDRPLPHLRTLIAVRHLLQLDAVLKAHDGDMAGAMEDVRLMLRLRRMIGEEPAFISKLVAIRLDDTAFSTMAGVLQFGRADAESLKAVMAELENREQANRMTRPLIGETAMMMRQLEIWSVDATSVDWPIIRDHPRLFNLLWSATADRYYFLRAMARRVEISQMPIDEALNMSTMPEGFEGPQSPIFLASLNLFTRQIVPAFSAYVDLEATQNAKTTMARAVLAAALYRNDAGSYPETLQALAPKYLPAIPVDPFDAKPLKFTLKGEGFVVYSVGRDRDDDGAAVPSKGNFRQFQDGDIAWEVTK